jgi:hypothetical protein
MWYLFNEQSIRLPIKLSSKQVGNANFGTAEVVHQELRTL